MDKSLMAQTLPQFNDKLTGHALFTEWLEWKESFEVWCNALDVTSQAKKFNWLLVAGGREMQRIYSSTAPTEEEINEVKIPLVEIPMYNNAIYRLDSYFQAKSNPRLERQIFGEMSQERKEPFNVYMVKLRAQAIRCGFEAERLDEEVYFQIMKGAWSVKVRQYAATETTKTLDNLMSFAINDEIKYQHDKKDKVEEVNNSQQVNVNIQDQVVAALSQWNKSGNNRNNHNNFRKQNAGKCYRCGAARHVGNSRCPAVDAVCRLCNKKGHFGRVCLAKRKEGKSNQNEFKRGLKRDINRIEDEEDWDVILPKMPKVNVDDN